MKRAFGIFTIVIGMWQITFAQFSQSQENQYLQIDSYVTRADIINAAVIVDPLAEKLKDISIENFSLRIHNKTGQEVLANMHLQGWVTLEEDRQREQSVIADTKKPFSIPSNGRIFSSKDADKAGSDIDFDDHVNEDLKKKLKDKVLDPASGGRVPSGLYEVTFTITVVSIGGVPVSNESNNSLTFFESVNVTNPTTAVLNLPFNNGYVYPTPFPQFQWTYDTRAVMLSVYEKRPEHQSLEDAITASDPFLQVKILRKESGNLTTFNYPQSASSRPGVEFIKGPRQLERGKMYVVVLDGITTAFGFEVEPLRTIRSFVIADPQGQVIMNVLQTAFSSGDFQNIFNAIQDLDLIINTNGITLNGVKLTPQDLQKLLIDNKDRITSVRIED